MDDDIRCARCGEITHGRLTDDGIMLCERCDEADRLSLEMELDEQEHA